MSAGGGLTLADDAFPAPATARRGVQVPSAVAHRFCDSVAMSAAVRVAVLNDFEIIVAGLAAILEPYRDRVRVVELASGTAVAADVDVVLYDSFGQQQGRRMRMAEDVPDGVPVLAFSWNMDAALVRDALRAGAAGYLAKGTAPERLVEAIERIAAGERVVPEPPSGSDNSPGNGDGSDVGRWPGDEHGLSAREAEVLALLCQGLSNEEVAERAFIGVNTVKTHIRTLYRKIGVSSRTQAVVWGHNHGFDPDRSRRIV